MKHLVIILILIFAIEVYSEDTKMTFKYSNYEYTYDEEGNFLYKKLLRNKFVYPNISKSTKDGGKTWEISITTKDEMLEIKSKKLIADNGKVSFNFKEILTITNLYGANVISDTIHKNKFLDFSNLPKGNYFIIYKNNEGKLSKLVILY